jgi:hypothetical protein
VIESATPFPDNVNVLLHAYLRPGGARGGRGAAAPAPGWTRRRADNNNPSNTVVMSWSFHKLPMWR